jgi:hypothetical protein
LRNQQVKQAFKDLINKLMFNRNKWRYWLTWISLCPCKNEGINLKSYDEHLGFSFLKKYFVCMGHFACLHACMPVTISMYLLQA